MNINEVKLTEYSHGAGCGCKIAPDVLDKILKSDVVTKEYPNLLVGNSSNDDAAAFDIGDGTCVLSTTDFFMPIVDDPYTFGKIAATNAISDVYAMGGKPIMAIAILGWPIKVLDVEVAKKVVEGGKAVCEAANIPLSGGHSIDSPEPIFGLAVTGIVQKENLKQNNKAKPNCSIFLTKPLGIGILSTAQKRKKIEPGHIEPAVNAMCTLNSIGSKISQLDGVVALTDVTGFGLCGHLNEICNGSNISATIEYSKVPLLENTIKYYQMGCIPGGTKNNYACYKENLGEMTDEQKMILCDAQTSGGLLAIVENDKVEEFKQVISAEGLSLEPIGYTTEKKEKNIYVK